MNGTVVINGLLSTDEAAVRGWLRRYLCDQVATWSEALGLGWSSVAVEEHIDGHHLVERDWRELAAAAADPARFVAVARAPDGPIGLVFAESRRDRYLLLRLGVLSWIYVVPEARGAGVSTRLMEAALAWMRVQHLEVAEVFVTGANPAAVELYRRSGFVAIDHRMLARLATDGSQVP